MAEFKRVDDQQVYTLEVYDADAVLGTHSVGSVISRNASTKEIAPVADAAAAKQAIDDGLQLYLIAQSDAVTNKTGTGYKYYDLDKDVEVSTDSGEPSLLAAYRIDNIDNIIW